LALAGGGKLGQKVSVGYCKLCNEYKKLVKAHIIPQSFHLSTFDNGEMPRIKGDKYNNKRSSTGIYDYMLCSDCESIFSPWDDYAYDFLTSPIPQDAIIGCDNISYAYQVNNFNYEKLKLFFLSFLWRASVTQHPCFNNIQLGKYEKILRKMILTKDADFSNEFTIIISKLLSTVSGYMFPVREKIKGINFYRFWIGEFQFLIKVDQRSCPKVFLDCELSDARPLLILLNDFNTSGMKKIMIETLKKANKNIVGS